MKILQVNCVYKQGSTGKIVYDLHQVLQDQNVESVVCYGRGQKESEKSVYKTSSELLAKFNALRSRVTGLQYNGSIFATNKLLRIIKKEQPDVVHLQCINGHFVNIYRLLDYLKRNKVKTVITLHAEFMHTGNCGHAYDCEKWKSGCGDCPRLWVATKSYWFDRTHVAWRKMKDALDGFEDLRIVSVSTWLDNRAKNSPIMYGHSFSVIHNGIDTDHVFTVRDYRVLKREHCLGDEKIILHVTASFSMRSDDVKGGRFVVLLAERLKGLNVKIIVIGSQDLSMELPGNVINAGRISDQVKLASYYSMADLTLITSERETFSMVSVESLSCGTPVVGFKAGGPESIALENYSEFVEFGDLEALEKIVVKWLDVKAQVSPEVISRCAQKEYSRTNMALNYLRVYEELNRVKDR